ncbi:hypothetical protein RhiirA4_485076 [Rhizophagus irregularis]|uniref:Uncharacterized protein n=1 Tax=Rhizophagus irregularis TaxID=588596 RepID=A0A2I1HPR2_9GLOM|nr:hypothetical protein RhiirA4_485076 [Rhizophagus irregularis]
MDDEDFSLYNTINQWIVNKLLAQQREDEVLFQFHSNDNLNYTEDVFPPEFKRHKGRKRIKSAVENNVRSTTLSDKTNITGAILRDTYEDQESKSSKRKATCKKRHGIGHYAKTCTI